MKYLLIVLLLSGCGGRLAEQKEIVCTTREAYMSIVTTCKEH